MLGCERAVVVFIGTKVGLHDSRISTEAGEVARGVNVYEHLLGIINGNAYVGEDESSSLERMFSAGRSCERPALRGRTVSEVGPASVRRRRIVVEVQYVTHGVGGDKQRRWGIEWCRSCRCRWGVRAIWTEDPAHARFSGRVDDQFQAPKVCFLSRGFRTHPYDSISPANWGFNEHITSCKVCEASISCNRA